MRRIIILIYLPLVMLLSLPYMLITFIISLFDEALGRKAAYLFTRSYGIGILVIAGAQLEIRGLEHLDQTNTYLFVANHRSLLDSPLLTTLSRQPLSFISKIEMKKIPVFRQWMALQTCLFLDRSSTKEGLKIILQGIEYMKKGYSMAVFPQGTRSIGEDFLSFKAGSLKLATKSGCPILPIAIAGTENVLENNGFNVTRARVLVHILPPVETKDLSPEELKLLPKSIEQQIHQQYDLMQTELLAP